MEKDNFKAGNHGYVANEKMTSQSKSAVVDMTDPSLTEAWKDVTNMKTPTNWCAFGFSDKDTTKLVSIGSGAGGHKELKTALKSWSKKIVFCVLRVVCTDKAHGGESQGRQKYVDICYVGSAVPEYDRAAVNFQKGKVRPFFGSTHLSMDLRGERDLDGAFQYNEIVTQMDAACAAHKPSHYNFGDGTEVAVADVKKAKGGDSDKESDDDFD